MRISLWCEFLEYEKVMSKQVVDLLKKYKVDLNLAVTKDRLSPTLVQLMRIYEEAALTVTLWPLLPDELGYWPSERNVDGFLKFIDQIFDWAKKEKVKIPWLAIDLEPPLDQRKGLGIIKMLGNLNQGRFRRAREKYQKMVHKIHTHGTKVMVVTSNFVLEDLPGKTIFQDFLESPISGILWDRVSFMIYNSFFKTIPSETLLYVLYRDAKLAKRWFRNVNISLGVVGSIGKLGNEVGYSKPEKLEMDIKTAMAAGVNDISIYSLDGLLQFDPELWLEKITDINPSYPVVSLKGIVMAEGKRVIPLFLKIIEPWVS